jgi:hypothetical protein
VLPAASLGRLEEELLPDPFREGGRRRQIHVSIGSLLPTDGGTDQHGIADFAL